MKVTTKFFNQMFPSFSFVYMDVEDSIKFDAFNKSVFPFKSRNNYISPKKYKDKKPT